MKDLAAFYQMRNDRSMRYAGRVLAPEKTIAITVELEFLNSPAGQAATMVAANLLARMTPSVILAFPDTDMLLFPGREKASSLHTHCLDEMFGADPHGNFEVREFRSGDYRLHLGKSGSPYVVHGSGWNSYVGPSPSPLPDSHSGNIFGATFAVVTAVAKIFASPFPDQITPSLFNLFNWDAVLAGEEHQIQNQNLGSIWFVGAGSVGSAAAYFMSLAGMTFDAAIFDRDLVQIENLDRSPVFRIEHVGHSKAEAVAHYLQRFGITAHSEPVWLDESQLWIGRQSGTPDILVSAANERNVRYTIESQFPPVQIYGTTGRNWQAAVFRHIPLLDPCSCCIFPPASGVTKCASGPVSQTEANGETKQVDAALPFLSFAAGLMAAVEISKLTFGSLPKNNRAYFTPVGEPIVYSRALQYRDRCICVERSTRVHSQMIAGSKYAALTPSQ